jgi:L,D-transpeptidase ErfK/SrfK
MKTNRLHPLVWASLLGLSILPLSAFSATYQMPARGNDLVGEVFVTQAQRGEDLDDIAKRFGMSMHEMMEANPGIEPYSRLRGGKEIVVPAQFVLPPYRKGIVVNLAELRIYYFTPDGKQVITYPVGLGRDEWRTPLASTTVVRKTTNPVWTAPPSIRQFVYQQTGRVLPPSIPAGPENPLGHYAMYLGTSGYLIHGTNQPETIGKFVSAGCIRMNNPDVQDLYMRVPVGAPVHIINNPYKVGWSQGRLYMKSNLPVDISSSSSDLNRLSWQEAVQQKAGNKASAVNWRRAAQVAGAHGGIPQVIGDSSLTQAANEQTGNRQE